MGKVPLALRPPQVTPGPGKPQLFATGSTIEESRRTSRAWDVVDSTIRAAHFEAGSRREFRCLLGPLTSNRAIALSVLTTRVST
jgi:hypothetical protein